MKFEIYMGKGKEWRWRLVAANGEIIASGQGYTERASVLSVIELIKSGSSNARLEELLALPTEVDEVIPVVATPSVAKEAISVIIKAAVKAANLVKADALKAAKAVKAEAVRVKAALKRKK